MTADIPRITDDPHAREALSRVRVLYTDLDGTLVAKGGSILADADATPSLVVAEQIVALNRAGLAVVPISGRGRIQLRELTQLLGWDGYIAEAGGIIVHGTGLDFEDRVDLGEWPADAIPPGVSPFEAINDVRAAETLMEAFPGRIEHYAPWQLDREVSLLLRGCLDTREGQAVLDTLPLPLDLVDNGMLRSYGTLTCRDMPPHAYHVVPRGVCKARAIELDLAWRGLSREQAAAIGDSATDLQMADAVGVMALVANAFGSNGVTAGLKREPRDNVWCTAGERTEGWAEFARAWRGAIG
ncbi:MAG: HAD hydrolase family protein [Coriobacteriia bacterium]|nr:HAD hydrolase family protein [Coriobacteriia bacterium]MBN2847306.1 HAD hydrolase family protein [Coriobacteriia bacterium]